MTVMDKVAKDSTERYKDEYEGWDDDIDDDFDDFDWEDDEGDEEEPKKRKTGRGTKYPVFNWRKLSGEVYDSLKSLINAAEKKLIPDNGLTFSYRDVNLVHMEECTTDYLLQLQDEIAKIDSGNMNHNAYHDYLDLIISWYFIQLR